MVSLLDSLRAKDPSHIDCLLKEHVRDSLERSLQIWSFICRNKEKIEYEFIKSEGTFKTLAKALVLHDLGKIDYAFQKEMFKEERKTQEWKTIENFFTTQKPDINPRKFEIGDHEILSVIHTIVFLGNDIEDEKIRTAILLHHYNKFFAEKEQHITRIIDDYPDVENYIKFMEIKKEDFKKFYQELIEYLKNEFEGRENAQFIISALSELMDSIKIENISNLRESIENGFGISNYVSIYGLYDRPFDDLLDFFILLGLLHRCDYSASANVKAEEILSIEEDVMDGLPEKIKQKIPSYPQRIWQEEILEKYKDKKHLVLIAPTGSGKTEFALLWAKGKGRKLLYTLPLRVALNDLFNRFSGDEEGYFDKDKVDLLHSTAFIEYLKGENKGKSISIDEKLKEIKMFASPIILTTPDQVFLSSLRFYGFDKLLAIYPLASIVLDEIQAYDPEMAAIIIKTLKIVEETKGSILVITATFPPYYEDFLKYPTVDLKEEKNKISGSIKNYDIKRHVIELNETRLFSKDEKGSWLVSGIEEIKKILHDNSTKNILIIVNNVLKAIRLFETLSIDPTVHLLHSRLIEKEKTRRIKDIKSRLESKKKRVIVISTQLVEASIDFDFDILITEISPIDSQIQRWGRIYRNRKEDYDENQPNIYIFTEIDKGTEAIYRPKDVLDKTVDVLKNKVDELKRDNLNPALGYEDERDLVLSVYNDDHIKKIYTDKIKETLSWLDIYQASKKSEAQRIFRRIVGSRLIVPSVMNLYEEEIENDGEIQYIRKLSEILRSSGWKQISWKDIARKVFDEEPKSREPILKILKWMYEYSVPIPEYLIEKHLFNVIREFNGFYVLDLKEEDAKKVKKYGIDIIKDMDLDEYLESILD